MQALHYRAAHPFSKCTHSPAPLRCPHKPEVRYGGGGWAGGPEAVALRSDLHAVADPEPYSGLLHTRPRRQPCAFTCAEEAKGARQPWVVETSAAAHPVLARQGFHGQKARCLHCIRGYRATICCLDLSSSAESPVAPFSTTCTCWQEKCPLLQSSWGTLFCPDDRRKTH